MPVSFARDLRPLFRNTPDVDTMQAFGIDLSSYESVKTKAAQIYERLREGTMPCDGPWPDDRVALFDTWMKEGMAP